MTPTLGQVVTYITDRGDARTAICTSLQDTGVMLHVFLNPGDDQFSNGPVQVFQNVPNDSTGTQLNSWH